MKRTQMTVRWNVSESQSATTGWIVSIELVWWNPVEHATTGLVGIWAVQSRVAQSEQMARVHGVDGKRTWSSPAEVGRRQGEDVEDMAAKAEEQHLDADVEVPTHKSWRVEDVAGDAADAALGQMSSYAQSKKCSRKSKSHSDHLEWSKISTTTRCETTAILHPSKFASCATMLGPLLGFRSGFENCKTQWNNVGASVLRIAERNNHECRSESSPNFLQEVHRATTSLPLLKTCVKPQKKQQVENPENWAADQSLCTSLPVQMELQKHFIHEHLVHSIHLIRLFFMLLTTHLWLRSGLMRSSVARHQNTLSSSFVSHVVLSGLTRVLYTCFIHIALSSFHNLVFMDAEHCTLRDGRTKWGCVVLLRPKYFSQFMSSTCSTSLKTMRARRDFQRHESHPTHQLRLRRAVPGSYWSWRWALQVRVLLHHCQRRREEQEQTWLRLITQLKESL